MDVATRELVSRRADQRCEYCGIRQIHVASRFQVEHVIAKQHGGTDDPGNLALACDRCNAYKGPNLSAIDPGTGNVVPLFHPRKDRWQDHFSLYGAMIAGRSDIGRATVRLLKMNAHHRVQLRLALESGAAPSKS